MIFLTEKEQMNKKGVLHEYSNLYTTLSKPDKKHKSNYTTNLNKSVNPTKSNNRQITKLVPLRGCKCECCTLIHLELKILCKGR